MSTNIAIRIMSSVCEIDSWFTMWTKLKLYINHLCNVNDVNDANKANAIIDNFKGAIVKSNWGGKFPV